MALFAILIGAALNLWAMLSGCFAGDRWRDLELLVITLNIPGFFVLMVSKFVRADVRPDMKFSALEVFLALSGGVASWALFAAYIGSVLDRLRHRRSHALAKKEAA